MITIKNNLSYRKNCEGYFLYQDKFILAQKSPHGYIIFPGGGINRDETPEEALRRETKEETGAIISEELKPRGNLIFKYTKSWAKTEKQKLRFKKYCGEQMFFFSGQIESLGEVSTSHKDAWNGPKLMLLEEVKRIIEQSASSGELRDYRFKQKSILKSLTK